MLDVVIKGGTVVDGTGAEGFAADIGVKDGRIVAIRSTADGGVSEEAAETIDATGQIVCPGFVDPHTHYDAQIFWDPYSTPSNLFGVTSMVAGNCGFSLAPLGDAADGEYLKHMMTKVEGIALEALEQGVPWNWLSFAEYLDRVEESGTAINVAFMVGHSAIRRMVMKEDSVGKEATPEQLAEMRALLKTSIEAGGFGFSTGRSFTHSDADGQPVPSRWAAWEEVLELCEETSLHEGTTLEWVADGCLNGFDDDEVERPASNGQYPRQRLVVHVGGVDGTVRRCEDAKPTGMPRREFAQQGFVQPIPLEFLHFSPFGGSFHCATLDVRRQGSLESYF